MRLAVHSFQFPLLSLESACRVVAALDINAIDIGALKGYAHLDPDEIEDRPHEIIARTMSACGEHGLCISDILPSFGLGTKDRPLNDLDSAVRAANARRFQTFVQVAQAVGSPGVTLLPGLVHPSLGPGGSLALAAQVLSEYVHVAQEAGLRLSFEGHLGSVASTPQLALDLVRQVPGLSVTLDYSHFIAQGFTEEQVDSLVPFTGHVHFRQARPGRVQVGAAEGVLDSVRLVRKLQSVGYAGYFTIEYTWQDWEDCKNVDTVSETILIRDAVIPVINQHQHSI